MKILLWDSKLSAHLEQFRSLVPENSVVTDTASSSDLEAAVAEAEIIVTSTLPSDLARKARRLRLLHAAGIGTDGIPFDELGSEVKVAVTGHHEESIAEHVVMSLIALQRGIRSQDAQLRMGKWASAGQDTSIAQPTTLKGRVATFLGFGAIGQAAWGALRHFGVEGIAISRSGSADARLEGLRWSGTTEELDDALEESSLLIISVPLDEQTRSIIGAAQLMALGEDGLVVNVARGPVVDEVALFEALSRRSIAGAAIDVWYRYPGADGVAFPSNLPFGHLDNILMTPHSSGVTQQTFRERVVAIAGNIDRFARGLDLQNEVLR